MRTLYRLLIDLPTMLSEISQEELSATLDAVVRDLLSKAAVTQPPIDAFALAQALGITVATDDRQSGRARFVRLRGLCGRAPRPTILVRSDPRSERRQWAIAHEIGEQTAVHVFHALAVDPRETSPNAREAVANHLAGRFLLPGEWFARDAVACDWDLLALKRRYLTASHELIARRMLDLTVAVIVSIFDRGRLSLRRANVPGRVPPLCQIETDCWQTAHHSDRPAQARDGTRLIQSWPVHEPDWKREILRTELPWDPLG